MGKVRQEFQAWSHDKRVYDGGHDMEEVVYELTVSDVLWKMYELNVELNDENLERILDMKDGKIWFLMNAKLEQIIEDEDFTRED